MCKQATASTYTVFNHVITRLKKTGLCTNKPLRPHTLCAFKPLRPHSVYAFKPLRPHTLCANKAYHSEKYSGIPESHRDSHLPSHLSFSIPTFSFDISSSFLTCSFSISSFSFEISQPSPCLCPLSVSQRLFSIAFTLPIQQKSSSYNSCNYETKSSNKHDMSNLF